MSKETKHVPAPWSLSTISGSIGPRGGIAIDAIDPNDGMLFEVAEVWGIDIDDVHDERSRANANLICAAPQLLEALEVMTALCRLKYGNLDKEVFAEIEKAELAIAAAKGE